MNKNAQKTPLWPLASVGIVAAILLPLSFIFRKADKTTEVNQNSAIPAAVAKLPEGRILSQGSAPIIEEVTSLDMKLIQMRTEKSLFFAQEIVRQENDYRNHSTSEAGRQFALLTWRFLKNEELGSDTGVYATPTDEIKETSDKLTIIQTTIQSAKARFDSMANFPEATRESLLRATPYYNNSPSPFDHMTPSGLQINRASPLGR